MLKRCSRGDDCVHPLGCWQPATAEYFHASNGGKHGLKSACKACCNRQARQYYENHRDALQSRGREYGREYYKRNSTQIREKVRKYRNENPIKVLECNRNYRRKNPDLVRAYRDRYYQVNRVRVINQCSESAQRRRVRKRGLPYIFNQRDWQRALDYFNGCCAVCGRPLRDLFGTHTAAMDHWIALTDPRPDNPGTVPTNIVPLCHGVGGCNNRKSSRDPVEFLETEFGKRKARVILKRVNDYFDWVRGWEDVDSAA